MTVSAKSWKALRDRMATGRLMAYPSILPSPKRQGPMTDMEHALSYMMEAHAKRFPAPEPRPGEAIRIWWDEAENLLQADRVTIGLDLGTSPAVAIWRPRKPDEIT